MLIKRSHRIRDDQNVLIDLMVQKGKAASKDAFIRQAIDNELKLCKK